MKEAGYYKEWHRRTDELERERRKMERQKTRQARWDVKHMRTLSTRMTVDNALTYRAYVKSLPSGWTVYSRLLALASWDMEQGNDCFWDEPFRLLDT